MNKNKILHTELRVGNWVDNSAIYCQVTAMDIVSAAQCEIANVYNGLDGIKITTDMIIKLGFEKDVFHAPAYKKTRFNFLLTEQKNNNWLVWSNEYEDVTVSIVNSLHQLQNLYYALTGEELEVKL